MAECMMKLGQTGDDRAEKYKTAPTTDICNALSAENRWLQFLKEQIPKLVLRLYNE